MVEIKAFRFNVQANLHIHNKKNSVLFLNCEFSFCLYLICLSKLCVFDGIFFPGTRKQKYIDLNVSLVFASLLLKLSRLDNIFFLYFQTSKRAAII